MITGPSPFGGLRISNQAPMPQEVAKESDTERHLRALAELSESIESQLALITARLSPVLRPDESKPDSQKENSKTHDCPQAAHLYNLVESYGTINNQLVQLRHRIAL